MNLLKVDAQQKAHEIADIARDVKARDVRIIDLGGQTPISDYFVVCTGTSDTHTKSIADTIIHEMKGAHRVVPKAEGREGGSWILIDYGDVVAHIFLPDAREFYDIESLWADPAARGVGPARCSLEEDR
jgi:ribosome-associated protein